MSYSNNGNLIQDDDTLSVGGCMRIIDTPDKLCSNTGFKGVLPIKDPDDKPYWTALDAFVYALEGQNINGSRVSISDESATPSWPESEFIQPLQGLGTAASNETNETSDDDPLTRFRDRIEQTTNGTNRIGSSNESENATAGMLGHTTFITLLGTLLVRRLLVRRKATLS